MTFINGLINTIVLPLNYFCVDLRHCDSLAGASVRGKACGNVFLLCEIGVWRVSASLAIDRSLMKIANSFFLFAEDIEVYRKWKCEGEQP
jgi:hypothetical protein